jgi:hypothetical protein
MTAIAMRKLHLVVGVITVLIFLVAGQIMGRQTPMATLGSAARLRFRSRHMSANGLFALFGGSMAHLVSSIGQPGKPY